jgi:farnesyl-diphosphate farnesyltransferase
MSDRSRPGSREILRRTSRTFALSITALPRRMRGPVEVAYLLARVADTIADTELAAAAPRRALLAQLRGTVVGGGREPVEELARLGDSGPDGADPVRRAEAELLRTAGTLLARFRELPEADRRDVRDVVARLIQTMEGELAWIEQAGAIAVMPDGGALTRYTEGIAGCVGAFWTRLVARHAVRLPPERAAALELEGRRYGRGLQLINVLRDLPRDLRRGRCFLPADELAALGLTPDELLSSAAEARLRPLLRRWEGRARHGVLAGLVYTTRLPVRKWSVRLATCLPAGIGAATLERLSGAGGRLDPNQVIRVGRGELRWIVLRAAAFSLTGSGRRKLAGRFPPG